MKTEEALPYFQIEKLAHGKSPSDAKKRADKIRYSYKIQGNQLIFDNYLLTEIGNKFRDQKVELFLYLPKGTLFKPDTSVENYDQTDNDFFNLHSTSDNYTYKVDESKVKCLNCPIYENEYNDVEGNENDQ